MSKTWAWTLIVFFWLCGVVALTALRALVGYDVGIHYVLSAVFGFVYGWNIGRIGYALRGKPLYGPGS